MMGNICQKFPDATNQCSVTHVLRELVEHLNFTVVWQEHSYHPINLHCCKSGLTTVLPPQGAQHKLLSTSLGKLGPWARAWVEPTVLHTVSSVHISVTTVQCDGATLYVTEPRDVGLITQDGTSPKKNTPQSQGVLDAEEIHECWGRIVTSEQPLVDLSHISYIRLTQEKWGSTWSEVWFPSCSWGHHKKCKKHWWT